MLGRGRFGLGDFESARELRFDDKAEKDVIGERYETQIEELRLTIQEKNNEIAELRKKIEVLEKQISDNQL